MKKEPTEVVWLYGENECDQIPKHKYKGRVNALSRRGKPRKL